MNPFVRFLIPAALFSAVSVASFSIWAFGAGAWFSTTTGLYVSCAVVFFLLGGLALLPYSGSGERSINFQILWLFPVSFLIFATCWCAGWFSFRSHFGEIMGSAVGFLGMVALFKMVLGLKKPLLEALAVVFLCYTIGYYLGEKMYQTYGGTPGKLLWGSGFGAGMGAGLSYLIQLSAKSRN